MPLAPKSRAAREKKSPAYARIRVKLSPLVFIPHAFPLFLQTPVTLPMQPDIPVTRSELGDMIREECRNALRDVRNELGDNAPATAADLRQILRQTLRENFSAPRQSSAS